MKNRFFLLLSFILIFVIHAAPSHAGELAAREVLPNGLILLHAERKSLPIVNIVVAVKAGSIMESYEKAGLSNLTADLLNEGTTTRTAGDISEQIDFTGGQLSTSGGDDYITITLSVLKKDIELGFSLLSDIIVNPSFPPEEVERRRQIIKNFIIRQDEDPGAVASKAFQKAVFGEHPYGWPLEGTAESLDNITRQDIVDFHRSYYAPNNSIMSVAGDIDRDEIISLINRYFKNWRQKKIKTLQFHVPGHIDRPRLIKIDRNITQANIILGHDGIKRSNPDYYAVSVMNYILGGGGFASRLMDNIRDNKGLAYDVYSYFSSNKYAGSFRAALQTKNASANSAIREILKEIERIRTEPVTDKELEDAKAYLTGSFPLRIDSNRKISRFLAAVEFYGLGLDYIDSYRNFIESVTKDDVLHAAKKYLDPMNYTLVVVGDIKKAALEY